MNPLMHAAAHLALAMGSWSLSPTTLPKTNGALYVNAIDTAPHWSISLLAGAAIGLMRSDSLSAPPVSCLLFALSFLSGGAVFLCQTCALQQRVATWWVWQFSTQTAQMRNAGCRRVFVSFVRPWCWRLMCAALWSLGLLFFCFTEAPQCRVSSPGLKSGGFLYFMGFLLIWNLTLGPLQRTISKLITKTKIRYW